MLIAAVFLPWYATNLGTPFTPASTSGWDATAAAKAVVPLGAVIVLASVALALDARGALPLDAGLATALRWVALAAAIACLGLVGYRLLRLPEPAAFLSREGGLYLAAVGAVAAVLAGLAQVGARS